MTITVGTQLGSHEITGLLGKGGMGEVYRARDTKLKRNVALKILPEEFSREPDRVSRFQREAEVLASLNHPNIAAIYDLQEADGTRFLVLELVDGETLAERIHRGPIPVEEALDIAVHICDALEAAHDRGVIHRDLKPANVKITPDGKVKVLDFGLAKAMSGAREAQGRQAAAVNNASATARSHQGIENAPASVTLSNSPTMLSGTMGGMILGTAAYMSPEQARGRAADQRSDVFAFGCVLYEMLTGRQAFQGEEASDVLASVLKTELDFTLLPPDLNPRIRDVVRRCLQKNPKSRWHAIADVRLEIEAALADPQAGVVAGLAGVVSKPPLWQRAWPILAAIIGTAIASAVIGWNLKPSQPRTVARFPILLGEGQQFTGFRFGTQLAISSDGTQIVYAANRQLYHRSISEQEARPIQGTETGDNIFGVVFSPDGQSVAYRSVSPNQVSRGLKKIAVTGGVPTQVCECTYGNTSLSWFSDGIYLGGTRGVLRVSPNGGTPETIVAIKDGEVASSPQILPGGNAVLFTLSKSQPPDPENSEIVVQSLRSTERHTLVDHGTDARYAPTGQIVYGSGGNLYAVRFDAQKLKVTGEPVRVLEGVRRSTVAAVEYSFSDNGSLIYVTGPASGAAELAVLALMDREGNVEPLKLPAGAYAFPRMSPDGKRVAFEIDEGKQSNIWIYEPDGTQAPRQLTVGGANRYPVWAEDGARIAFQSDREGDLGIFWQRADGTGAAERLTKPEPGAVHIPDSWSNNNLSFTVIKGSESAISILSLKDKKTTLFMQSRAGLIARSAFSPDGHWLAYQQAGETGRNRLWVQPFPATGTRYPIVEGSQPFWSRDGNEIFFNAGAGGFISRVNITTRPSFAFSNEIAVARGQLVNASSARFPRNADATPDGKILGLAPVEALQARIEIVLNWFEELRQRMPVK